MLILIMCLVVFASCTGNLPQGETSSASGEKINNTVSSWESDIEADSSVATNDNNVETDSSVSSTESEDGLNSSNVQSGTDDTSDSLDKEEDTVKSKYDYDMSKYIVIPDYKRHIFDVNEDDIKSAIGIYLMQYAQEYKVNRGDYIQVSIRFYELLSIDIDAKGEEIKELFVDNVWLNSVATPNGDGEYQISFLIENGILGAKMGATVSRILTLDDTFFDENYRGQRVIVDITINNKTCKAGDVLTASYTGYYVDEEGNIILDDGEEKTFDQSDNSPFFIGSHLAIDDFEKGLIGMAIGEEKDVYATFPHDYTSSPELAGKRVLFKVKINSFFTPAVYDDNFVKEYFTNYQTIDEFEEALKKEFVLSKIYEYINANAQIIAYPEAEYNLAKAELESVSDAFLNQHDMTLEAYIQQFYGMTVDKYIKANMKTKMIFYRLCEMIGNSAIPTDEELLAEKEKQMNMYKEQYIAEGLTQEQAMAKAEEYVEALGENYIYEQVMYKKIDDILSTQVKINVIGSEKEYVWETAK